MMAIALACSATAWTAGAQEASKPAYLDTSLSPEQRAADLVQRMTLEEKATQLVNQARAIQRLNVPEYDWWSEALHGVINSGTTEFPEPVGLAATFDPPAIHRMAEVIGTEGRIKHMQAVRAKANDFFTGLDFWAPNVNIFRDPRWGRGQETYGEDPFLTARMGVAYVTGMQGDDQRYYRAIATPKHFAVHSGPESTRHTANVEVSKHDELDTYLPAFRAAIVEGKAGSIMCAYNDINGQPACANEFLLENQLRGWWGFKGYVVSDCGAVIDIHNGHKFNATQAESSAVSLRRGMDNECVDFSFKVNDDRDYKAYLDAVKQGYLKEYEIDTAVRRLFTARMKLGLFDPPEMVPYNQIDEKLVDSDEHRAWARKVADESMVLLKNDGVLPLAPKVKKIVVVGPLAEQTKFLVGNYAGTPSHSVSILEGIKKEFPGAAIEFVAGTQFLGKDAEPIPASAMTVDGKQGVKASYASLDMSDINSLKSTKPVAERVEAAIDPAGNGIPPEAQALKMMRITWEATLTAPESGEYNLGLMANGFYRVQLDGRDVTSTYDGDPKEAKLGHVHLEAGKPAALRIEYSPGPGETPQVKPVWSKLEMKPQTKAAEAAKKADVVVAVVGITSELEGEEMQVDEPGFKGGDRTSLDLPKPEEELIESLSAAGKPLVVVLVNGSALGVNWAQAHANAILEAWYPGEEGGAAVAETLSGKNNPAGRLPVTFYKSIDQLPPFENYAMKGRTYRYFEGEPLYPFGYGLSYTTFSYSGLTLPATPVAAGSPVVAEVTVTNTGKLAGDEVAQLYLEFPKVGGAPLKALRGFQRIHLDPGASQKLRFELRPRDLSIVTEAGEPIIAEGQYMLSIGGGQPHTSAQVVEHGFEVKGTLALPE
jgi:beta-glucosidase